LAKKGANETTEFDFIGQIRDAKGRLVQNVRDGIKVKLKEATASQVGKRSFEYDTGFTLPPGDYRLKFLARENQSGKMGTFETTFVVPDLYTKNDDLRISSVVWSSQRLALTDAVASVDNSKKVLSANPLIENNQKLIPSITRVFRKAQNLYVYLEAYDPMPDAEKKPNLVASVSFFKGRVKAFETDPVKLDQTAPSRPNVLPIQFQVPLAKLTPGQYICQVSVVDATGKKFAFPRAPMVLLP
jgi:hypothetical protein